MADGEWMYSGRTSRTDSTAEWQWKTDYYVKDANRGSKTVRPLCPCARCKMNNRQDSLNMTKHLWLYGYMPDFDMQINFPETDRVREEVMRQRINGNAHDGIANMLVDLHYANQAHSPPTEDPEEHEAPDLPDEPEPTAKAFLEMMATAKKPLYPGAEISQLDAISQLLADKAKHGETRSSFEDHLKTLGNMLPKGHCLPRTMYESKKIMKSLCMDYEKIHCCPKGCLLFRKEFAEHTHCSKCGASRYVEVKGAEGEMVQTKIAVKILRYLPFIRRIQRLYMDEETATQMTWHKTGKRYPDIHDKKKKMKHPADGEAWKHFDKVWPHKAEESRNVRIAIATDGFNPFGMSARSYSCWPVFVIPLNLPPGVLMQRKTIFLSLIIPGPDYPGKNLSVYMQPLIDDLQHSWEHGTWTYDRASKKNFRMTVWYQYSMHDLPGYALFCGHCTAGKMPCPVCRHALIFIWLKKGGKYSAFDKHRQFLPEGHRFRKDTKHFMKGEVVSEVNKIPTFDGKVVDAELRALKPKIKGKGFIGYGVTHNWTHIPGLTQLPYYKDLKLPHNIDVMHTEKNVAESVFHTTLNIPEKTKDNVKARVDQERLCDRKKLKMQRPEGKRKNWVKPNADFCLLPAQKKESFYWLKHNVHFPDGYCSNMSNGVNLATGKVNGLKSHDYHIWIERIMPVMLRGYLPDRVWRPLAELSHFFRTLCAKEICPEMMKKLHEKVPELICKLEVIFPPGMFTPMVHLMLHLPNEALLGGPVQNRWQFCIERIFKHMRTKCGNKNQIEACIAEAYIIEEVSDVSTTYYPEDVPTMHNPLSRYNTDDPSYIPNLLLFQRQGGKSGGQHNYTVTEQEWEDIMMYVLMNIEEVEETFFPQFLAEEWSGIENPDESEFDSLLRKGAPGRKNFVAWFMEKVISNSPPLSLVVYVNMELTILTKLVGK